jgi:HTH-type transcriptional regulator, competence development regulator
LIYQAEARILQSKRCSHQEETMSKQPKGRTQVEMTLGKYLGAVRADRKMTLRQVEEASESEISNAYLSQLENDKISKPSPNVLYSLSNIYSVEYDRLMELAGYITSTASRSAEAQHGRVPTFSEFNLTPSEEAELVDYLKFLRRGKPTRDEAR